MAKAKSKQASREVVGYRYFCTKTRFMGGRRIFAGQALTTERPLEDKYLDSFELREEILGGPRQVVAEEVEEEADDGEGSES